MKESEVRYRVARPIEKLEPYAFLLAWPAIFFGPYMGFMTWGLAFLPGLLVEAWQTVWKTMSPRVARVAMSDAHVELESVNKVVERIVYADVEAITSVFDKGAAAASGLRVERRGQRALVFDIPKGETPESLAAVLGIDAAKVRTRYKVATLLAPRGSILLVLGFGLLFFTWVGSPSPPVLEGIMIYCRFVFLPLVVIYAVPTQLEIARDGVAWKWLFIQRFVPYSMILAVESIPRATSVDKVHTLEIQTRTGPVYKLVLGKTRSAWVHVREAFEASKKAAPAEPPIDAWLGREKGETTEGWTKRLAAMAASDGAYRGVSVSHLWTLAEDVKAPIEQRAAAAIVLATTEEARERIRMLAAQVLDPKVRAFLEAVAKGAHADEVAALVSDALAAAGQRR